MSNNEFEKWKIKELSKEDVYRGWVRINIEDRKDANGNEKYKRKNLILIEKQGSNSKLIRRVLGNDDKENEIKSILMDFDTRYNDGKWNLRTNNITLLKITKIRRYRVIKILSYYWCHPDVAIRVSFKLGLLSIFISIIAILVAFRSELIAICEHIMNVIQSMKL